VEVLVEAMGTGLEAMSARDAPTAPCIRTSMRRHYLSRADVAALCVVA
jgi:hypothetical protein